MFGSLASIFKFEFMTVKIIVGCGAGLGKNKKQLKGMSSGGSKYVSRQYEDTESANS